MLPKDTIERRDSQGKIQRYVKSPSGVEYHVLVPPFNSGGVGQVYHAQREVGGRIVDFVIKEYPRPGDNPAIREQQQGIRKNLTRLIEHPLLDEDGKPIPFMVPPIEILDFPNTGTFGYVMDFVDHKQYTSVSRLLNNYPEMDIVCGMAEHICYFFDRLARGAGYCYKDVNEGNIYLNPKNADVRIIDNDNVGDPSTRTISGTGYYMAPEVQLGSFPDRLSDRFSLATYLLRLFTGARPYEGSGAVKYAIDQNKTINEVASHVFGSDPVFVFDPNDTSNTLKTYPVRGALTASQEKEKRAWRNQQILWELLPKDLQEMFIRAFVDGAHAPGRRPTAQQWRNLFLRLQGTLTTCPHCGKKTFGAVERCAYCEKKIKQIACKNCGANTPAGNESCVHCGKDPKKYAPKPPSGPVAALELDLTVLCKSARSTVTIRHAFPSPGAMYSGRFFDRSLSDAPLFTLSYNTARHVYALMNASGREIRYRDDRKSEGLLKPGERAVLCKNMQFRFPELVFRIDGLRG